VQAPDHYAVLGVPRDATSADISRAYRRLVRLHHPDLRGSLEPTRAAGSDATLDRVLSAYAVLRDPERRARYDRQFRPAPSPRVAPAAEPARRRAPTPDDQPPIQAGPVIWSPARRTG
jgi:curved DNA-binding protein CbpA